MGKKSSLDPQRRENQLIALAVDLAEEQLRAGTASSQVITHYLKLGSEKERLENELLRSKIESYESAKQIEELYKEAIAAMKIYSGSEETVECELTES